MNKTFNCFLLVLLLAVPLSLSKAYGVDPVRFRPDFTTDQGAVEEPFTAWVPDEVTRLRGLFISLPGAGESREQVPGHSLWQLRMRQMGFGIIGFQNGYNWGGNSEQARGNLQLVLDLVADEFGHPEISNAPVFLDGFSAGAFSAGDLASLVPERTIGFVSDKGYSNFDFNPGVYQAPGLAIGGASDPIVGPSVVHYSFNNARQAGANVGQLIERNQHIEASESLRLAYMNQIVRVRYPHGELPSLTPSQPLVLNEPLGWLAEATQMDNDGRPIYVPEPVYAPETAYPLDPYRASWYPTETMVRVFLSENENPLTTPSFEIDATSSVIGSQFLHLADVPMEFEFGGLDWQNIELYHEEELIAELNPGAGQPQFTYTARYNGFHTFYARLAYDDNGETKYTSDYFTTTVFGAVPEPSSLCLGLGFAVLFLPSRRKEQGKRTTSARHMTHNPNAPASGGRERTHG